MPEPLRTPDYVRCVAYQATVEPVEASFSGPFRMEFQFRLEDGRALFRITTQVHDDDLSVSQTHIAGFNEHPVRDERDEEAVTRFLDESVLPAVFPYIQEGVAAGATRVRPGKPLFVGWDFSKPLDLSHD
ncbi:hypothetical protein AB8O38_15155 [Saccharomonospora xinjiangensis]|uniref:hypothetical protein n=1 Tax=Saccharomonospora xinjiangensis TaxID=75294 RepID=UPI00350F946C